MDSQFVRDAKRAYSRKTINWPSVIVWVIVMAALVWSLVGCEKAYAIETEASWYSIASCAREGTSGICANGEKLDDEKLTCASWDYPFHTKLKVTNLENGKSVIVRVNDRGPNMRLYRKGRAIDLSRKAMRELDGIKRGIIMVNVEVLGGSK